MLVDIEAPGEGANLEVKPYALGSVNTDLSRVPPTSDTFKANGGLDVKYGITRGLTADFTYRTDFAQVESDEEQVNLSRFNLFFPEKREFFLEGAGIFNFGGASTRPFGVGVPQSRLESLTPIMFYSRRIGLNEEEEVPIVGGARLTGKAGAFSVGALGMQTSETPRALAPSTNFTVLRLRRNILRRSSVGFIATNRTHVSTTEPGANRLYGVDGSFVFYENVRLDAYYARAWTVRIRATMQLPGGFRLFRRPLRPAVGAHAGSDLYVVQRRPALSRRVRRKPAASSSSSPIFSSDCARAPRRRTTVRSNSVFTGSLFYL